MTGADDDGDIVCACHRNGPHYMADQRQTAEAMQHLGQAGPHPGPLTGRKNDGKACAFGHGGPLSGKFVDAKTAS
jgi:hypothetical protein